MIFWPLLCHPLQVVQRCHAMSLCHRDIKPSNFMLATTNDLSSLKVIDFGSAVFCWKGEALLNDRYEPFLLISTT